MNLRIFEHHLAGWSISWSWWLSHCVWMIVQRGFSSVYEYTTSYCNTMMSTHHLSYVGYLHVQKSRSGLDMTLAHGVGLMKHSSEHVNDLQVTRPRLSRKVHVELGAEPNDLAPIAQSFQLSNASNSHCAFSATSSRARLLRHYHQASDLVASVASDPTRSARLASAAVRIFPREKVPPLGCPPTRHCRRSRNQILAQHYAFPTSLAPPNKQSHQPYAARRIG
jgi:hypothetical protein